jgi:hypothetical protein
MVTHTLILTTPKFEIPSNPNIIEIINNLIHNNLVNIDYFGGQLDNQADFIDVEMELKINSTSFLTFHFDLNDDADIDYGNDEETTLNSLISILMENKIREVIVDEKDIKVYIY